jgi:phage host-nuclease inhibitor protein Gam
MSCDWSSSRIREIKNALDTERQKTEALERLVQQLVKSQEESNRLQQQSNQQQKELTEEFAKVSAELKLLREEIYPTVASTKPGLNELKQRAGGQAPAGG